MTSSPTPSSTTGWVALRDQSSGVRFSLPHHVDPESRPTRDPSIKARLYHDRIDEVGLDVTIVQTGVDIPAGYPRSVYDQMVAGLRQQGAPDARLASVKKSTVPEGDALDATLSFTAKDGSRNYWRMRTITAGHIMVQLQVLTFSDPDDADAPARVDRLFMQLADSVALD